MFAHILGNNLVKGYLTRMVEKNTIAQSLLFTGPDGIGKSLFAEAFAKLVFSQNDPTGSHMRKLTSHTHPDLRIYRPEGKIGMHSIDSLRQFIEDVYLPPYEAQRKIFVVHDADRMLSYSANAMLKTFEEPAPHSIIILLTSAPESLLPTVLSRCCTIRFQPVPEDDVVQLLVSKFNKTIDEARIVAGIANGSVGQATRLAEQGSNILRECLLGIMARGRMSVYSDLIEAAKEISAHIEQEQKELEDSARAVILKNFPDGLTSVQQHALDKEIDGALAMRLAEDAEVVFDVVLSWYRDMHLLQLKGDRVFLLHRDFQNEIEQALQRDELLPLETVQLAVSQAKLALERSTSFANCLENLFLRLNFL